MPHFCLFAHFLQLTLLMLHHCDTPQNMNSLVATLERYSLLWTCMDILPTIVAALDAAHQAWKVHGTQSRSLLLLLLKFDNNRYLSPISRDQIMSDVASFELVSDTSHSKQLHPNMFLYLGSTATFQRCHHCSFPPDRNFMGSQRCR